MATFNQPVVTTINDFDYNVTLKITGQYNTACSASNTVVAVANSFNGANSSRLCVLDITGVQWSCKTSNGFVSLEFQQAGGGNVTAWTLAGEQAGFVLQNSINPVSDNASATVDNAVGNINLALYNMSPNDAFDIVVTMRKNTFNQAWSNIGRGYDSAYRGNNPSL